MLDHPESGPHEAGHAAPTTSASHFLAAVMLLTVVAFDPFGFWRRQWKP